MPFTFINLNDAAVQASLIGAIGSIVAAGIAGLCAAIIGKQIAGRRKLVEKLEMAQDDIAFLLCVENLHGQLHKDNELSSQKLTVREAARNKGYRWSGRFTPGRVNQAQPASSIH
jgi:hypothetical protein